MDTVRSGCFPPGPGSTYETPAAGLPQKAEQKLQSPEVRNLSCAAATPDTSIRSRFVVTFDCSKPNTNQLAKLMKSISSSLACSELPKEPEQVILQLLNQINDIINSLQVAEIPASSITTAFVRTVVDKVIENRHLPDHVKKSVDRLFPFFSSCKYFDYFMYGSIDQKLCQSLAAFLSTLPEDQPEEIMAGAGWLQKGLKAQGKQIRSTDNFRINAAKGYMARNLGIEVYMDTGMQEHPQDFAVIEGATVENMDALQALESSSSRVVILCWPDPRPAAVLYGILEHCYKNRKLIIHIANKDESMRNIVISARRRDRKSRFIPVDHAPSSHIHLEPMNIGFWKQVPEWYTALKQRQQTKDSRPDLMIRHFEP